MRNASPVCATCPVIPTPTFVASTSSAASLALREVAAKRDRAEVVSVAEEDAAVVVVDQLPQLVGDRGADLVDLEQPGELARDAVEHLQVGDRADVCAPRGQRVRPLALVLVEDDDPALAARLGGHHRELGAGDELAWVGSVLGPERDPDRERHRADGVERRERDPLRDPLGECLRDRRRRRRGG